MADDDLTTGLPTEGGRDVPRSVTAFFDTRDQAEAAQRDLVAAGVAAEAVQVAAGDAAAAPAHSHGFWESLKDVFVPDRDRHVYAEGLRRGGIAVSVRTDAASHDRVLEILDRDGAVDMDEREAGWRDAGWDADGGARGEMGFAPPSDGTAGFGASRADQPLFEGPMDNAAIEPGLVVPAEPRRRTAMTPDAAYLAAAPGLASPADTAQDTTATPGSLQPEPGFASLDPSPARDLSRGRVRVRSYSGGVRDDGPAGT